MSMDVRQVALGTALLLASSALFLESGIDGRLSLVLAATALAAVVVAVAHRLGTATHRTV
ncbi:hypothetical protein [Halogeometricum limi]|uniref:Uncharacterized protein n=1 Tax=Halogeometricum limi TaxID=555875 RepID=A0A1I6GX90_9EURY|nr:hypothetical protein [Halogeometricum limi]SFR46689.1 hypothetical protein SAMN04488124_1642 [Halogeometricum limi]